MANRLHTWNLVLSYIKVTPQMKSEIKKDKAGNTWQVKQYL